MNKTLFLAARGWDHTGWDLYPDDLPPDWRLGFYGNEFDAVALPADTWFDRVPELHNWHREVPRMRFFLELPAADAESRQAAVQAVEALGTGLGGVFLAEDVEAAPWRGVFGSVPSQAEGTLAVAHWPGAAPELRALRACMEALTAGGKPALLVFTGNPPCAPALRQAGVLAGLLGLSS